MKSTTPDRALVQLLEKTVANKWRALVVAPDWPRLEALDGFLWTYRDESFLAHGLAKGPYPEDQPVLLSTAQENQNRADVLFLIDGAGPEVWEGYKRIILLFSDDDHAMVERARDYWREAKARGADISYWRQGDNGRFEKVS